MTDLFLFLLVFVENIYKKECGKIRMNSGPIPPWEQNSEAMAKDYEDRFARYALCKTIEVYFVEIF